MHAPPRCGPVASSWGPLLYRVDPKDVPDIKTAPNLVYLEGPGVGYQGLWVNTAKGPLASKALRQAVNLAVDREALRKAGLANGPADGVRVLGNGEVTKRLVVKAHHFSKSAMEKIKAKGGSADLIPPRQKPKRNKMKPRPPQE